MDFYRYETPRLDAPRSDSARFNPRFDQLLEDALKLGLHIGQTPKFADRYEPSKSADRYEPTKFADRYEPTKFAERYEPSTLAERYEQYNFAPRYDEPRYQRKSNPVPRYPSEEESIKMLTRIVQNLGKDLQRWERKRDEMWETKDKEVVMKKDGFEATMDLQHFAPNEISVNVEENSVVVKAKHEEKRDEFGYVTREITRRYDLPKDIKEEDVTSSLSTDGLLTIKALRRKATTEGKGRTVKIQQTGPERLA